MSIITKIMGAGALVALSASFNQSANSDTIRGIDPANITRALSQDNTQGIPEEFAKPTESLSMNIASFRQDFALRVRQNTSGNWSDCFSTKTRTYNNAKVSQLRRDKVSSSKTDRPIIVLDPGHGHEILGSRYGYDTGAIRGGMREVDVIDKVTTRLKEELEGKLDADVVTTRAKVSDSITLKERDSKFRAHATALQVRTELAAHLAEHYPERPIIFVSIHANSETGSTASGGMVFYYGEGGSADSAPSRKLAQSIASNYKLRAGARTITAQGDFAVLRCQYSSTPSVLVELGYVSNAKDRASMKNTDALARGLANGIASYLKLQRPEPSLVQIAELSVK